MTPAVEISGVTKTFGTNTAVNNLDLIVPRDCVYGFIGPNGSGKTTTLRMILRIFHPDQGRVAVFGQETGTAADDRIGYLPEERGLYKKMRVAELLRYYAALKGVSQCQPAIDSWLERLGLADRARDRIESLSKGMSQKVQFISAVVSKPELLILDEPFSGLDPVNRDAIKDAILDVRKQGTTVIFSTHDMKVAEQMCDTIFMIFRGKKVLDGTLAAIQAEYGSDTVRVRTPLDAGGCSRLPGVQHVNDFGQEKELRLSSGADPQATLRALVPLAPVDRFEVVHPSLHDIFVRIAGPAAEEPDHE